MTQLEIISNRESFHNEARWQRICAVCEKPGGFHAHHVIGKRTLEKLRWPLYDTRLALRLCAGLDTNQCHMQFEWGGPGKVKIATAKLLDVNICGIWAVLGVVGVNHLERYYSGLDDRYRAHLAEACECQQ